ncbi:general substrate transporter [Decorospora gaudefroyi]|uniref:General substrate transporter n=1 Tax=Decorospora gaudefroyi TaxID=184978 RepID=A0A6A5KWX9_9PLEO|nr:general substrate transporter [Decorospora gaudefroyi]
MPAPHEDVELDSMNDAAAEPLISNRRGFPNDARDHYDGDEEERRGQVDESAVLSPGLFIWSLTICAGISGLLFGYDTGVISSTLISVDTDLSSRLLTTVDKSLITSATAFFALLASPLTGVLADQYGRKTVILFADVLFVLGALWQAWTTSVGGMIAGRSIVGAAVGSASFVVPLYISELSPSPFRGRLVVVSTLFITAGQVVAYSIGWLFSERMHGWRWMVGLGALPAAIQFVMLLFLPETPRYLIKAGRTQQARMVLGRVYKTGEGGQELVNAVLRRVEKEIEEEEDAAGLRATPGIAKSGWRAKVGRVQDNFAQLVVVGGNRRALNIACMLQGFQQLCGFNSLMYFSATIFRLVGFESPTLTSLSIAITNFLFTLVAFHYIDRIGRRRILLWSVPIMVIGLILCAIAFRFLDLPEDEAASTTSVVASNKTWPLVILISMITYVAGYAIGMGNVPWQQSELFPLSVRSLGSAVSTATNWGSNTFIGITFLPMMNVFTPVGTFALYAGVCVVAWITIWRIYPETAGLGLEDVGGLLRDGYGVEDSLRKFNERRRGRGL